MDKIDLYKQYADFVDGEMKRLMDQQWARDLDELKEKPMYDNFLGWLEQRWEKAFKQAEQCGLYSILDADKPEDILTAKMMFNKYIESEDEKDGN